MNGTMQQKKSKQLLCPKGKRHQMPRVYTHTVSLKFSNISNPFLIIFQDLEHHVDQMRLKLHIRVEWPLKKDESKTPNLNGMAQQRPKLIRQQKKELLPKSQMRFYEIMLNFVGFIQVPRLREFWKRKPRSNYFLSKVVGHMTDQLYKFTTAKSAIEVLPTQVTYHTCIKIQLFEKIEKKSNFRIFVFFCKKNKKIS